MISTAEKINFDKWRLADASSNQKGLKTCALSYDGLPVSFALGKGLHTRYGATTWDKSSDAIRRNLDFDITSASDIKQVLSEIDEWTKGYIEDNSERLLGRKMTKDEVYWNYKPLLLDTMGKQGIRTKITLAGNYACSFWDVDRNPTTPPENGQWRNYQYDVIVSLPRLYVMSCGTIGWVCESKALQLKDLTLDCPF